MSVSNYVRTGWSIAIGTTLVLIWMSLGIGVIGADGDPSNRMYLAIPAILLVGSIFVRKGARGMSAVLWAMAVAQAVIAAIALIARLGLPWSGPLEIALLNGFFVGMFALGAWMFSRAARGEGRHQ